MEYQLVLLEPDERSMGAPVVTAPAGAFAHIAAAVATKLTAEAALAAQPAAVHEEL